MKISRREFHLLSSSALAALTLPRAFGKGLRVRRNINSLNTKELATFRAGVMAMRSLGILDVRSFGYQANTHGAPSGWEEAYPVLPPDVDVYWNQCEHGTYQFLPWHRWYVFYWEQILRELCGDDDFAMPYWDVTLDPYLPEAVRLPADASNSLYDGTRNPAMNAGTAHVVDVHTGCLGYLVYSEFSGDLWGLEDNPHALVHNQVGGNLVSVSTAACDPLFFLHHSNIDRFWQCWLNMGGGRVNPTLSSWLDHAFDFQSTTGPQTPVVSDGLTTWDLGYIYDTCPVRVMYQLPKSLPYLMYELWPLIEIPQPDPPPPWIHTAFTFEPLELDGHDKAFLLPRAAIERAGVSEAGSAAFLMSDMEATGLATLGGFYLDLWLAPDARLLASKGLDSAKRVGSFGNFQLSALHAHGNHNGAHVHHGKTPPFTVKLDGEAIRLLASGPEPALLFARRGIADARGEPLKHDPKAVLFKVGALSLVVGKQGLTNPPLAGRRVFSA